MTSCIFCSSPLLPDTKPEHVWLAALGGRKTTRQIICSGCNGTLGSSPDKALAESVALIRNLLNLASGRGAPPPVISGLRHGDDRVILKPGGVPAIDKGAPFTITELPDGSQSVELRVTSAEDLKRILPNLAAALRLSVDDTTALIKDAQARHTSTRVEGQHHRLSLGGTEPMRSMLKTCMTLWADRHGSDELLNSRYDDARQFVLFGGDELGKTICQIDMGALTGSAALTAKYGQHYNLALVASDAAGRTTGYLRLYNICAWRFTLCVDGAPPSATVAYISNPASPSDWKVVHDDSLVAAAAVLEARPSHDFETARAGLMNVNRNYRDRGSEEEIDRIVREAIGRLGLQENKPMTREQFDRFVGESSARLASWMLNIPYERALTPEEIARLLPDNGDDS